MFIIKSFSDTSIVAPASFNFDNKASICSSIIPLIFRLFPSKAPMIAYVPASIRSGITSITQEESLLTPSILISLVPAPLILAPILLSKTATFTISGSLAALEM